SAKIPLPPIPSLFPYATLFRSCGGDKMPGMLVEPRHKRSNTLELFSTEPGAEKPAINPTEDHTLPRFGYPCCGYAGDEHSITGRDRKSTRLNSSHVSISYAVFC